MVPECSPTQVASRGFGLLVSPGSVAWVGMAARRFRLRRAARKGGSVLTSRPALDNRREGLTMKHATEANTGSEDSILAGYVTPAELCAQLHKTPRTLARWTARGFGPPRVRIERMVLYRIADVRGWLTAHLERHELRQGQAVGSAGAGGGK